MNEFFSFMLGLNMNKDYTDSFSNGIGIWITIGVLVLVAGIFTLICFSNKKSTFSTQSLAFGAICIATSFALSFWKAFSLPQGGSVTIASLIPICLFAYIFGFKRGIFAALIYGILQIMQEPYILNFVQILLDYILAFATVALAGLVPYIMKKINIPQSIRKFDLSISLVFVGIFRFFFHFLSGYIYFGGDAAFSAAYNSFVFVDIAICLVVSITLQLMPHFVKFVNSTKAKVFMADNNEAISKQFEEAQNNA